MKRTWLTAIVLSVICVSTPSLAQLPTGYIPSGWYTCEFSDTFDGYIGNQDLAGQGGWEKVSTASTSPKVVDDVANAISPDHYFQQVSGRTSAASKDMRFLAPGRVFRYGCVFAWVYDPKLPSSSTTDTRVGTFSSAGADNIAKLFTANITSGSGLTGDYDYWRGQWSYSAFSLNGIAPAGGAGYTFTAGPTAPRSLGWSCVMITWNYTYTGTVLSAAHVEWYINPKFDGSDIANMMLDYTTASSRWANSKDVVGMYLGAYNVASTAPGRIDNVYFGVYFVPEPSGLLTLAAGLLTTAGLLRRRK